MGSLTAQIEALPLARLEALIDFQGQDELAAWFAALS